MVIFILYLWGAWIGFNVLMVLLSGVILRPAQPCCNGIVIMIPSWLAQVLTESELEAVKAHERGHLRYLHVWKNLLCRFVFMTPSQTKRLHQEFEADDYAAAQGCGFHLAVAIRKLSKHPDDVLRSERLLQRMGI